MKSITCCVTGHREIPEDKLTYVRYRIISEVQNAIEKGKTRFITGCAQGVDMIFAEAVLTLKKELHPEITLHAAVPFRAQYERMLRDPAARHMLDSCSSIDIVSEEYHKGVYHIRNRFMVDRSSMIIGVFDGRYTGGTHYTLKYAQQAGIDMKVIML